MDLNILQHYWWILICILGGLLVFLLFVQGGQSLLYTIGKNKDERDLIVNTLGHMGIYVYHISGIRRSFLRQFSPILLNQFRRSLCRLDADPLLFCLASGIL